MQVGQAIRISSASHMATNMTAAIDGFLIYNKSKNLSEKTIEYYGYRLRSFQRYLEEHSLSSAPKDVTRQLVREFINDEISRYSPSTANHSVTTLKVFFNFLIEDGYIESNPMDGVKKVRVRKPIIETFSQEQVEAIIKICDKSFKGIRDKAIIVTLFDCGLRASELCGIMLEDIDWKNQTIKVIGKGDKERVISFGQATRHILSQYLSRRPDLPNNSFFVTCYGGSIDRSRLWEIVQSRCKKAGIVGVRCSPHTFRHTFAVSYLRAGGDVFSLQKLLGHSDLDMTRRYCELSQTDALSRHRKYSPADRLKPAKPHQGRKKIV